MTRHVLSPTPRALALLLGVVLTLTACDDGGGGTTDADSDDSGETMTSTGEAPAIKGSCDNRVATDDAINGTCSDYTGDSFADDVSVLAQLCTNKEGAAWIAEGGCPQLDFIGRCVIWEDQPLEEVIYYYATYDPAEDGKGALYAESQCTNNAGSWTPL